MARITEDKVKDKVEGSGFRVWDLGFRVYKGLSRV